MDPDEKNEAYFICLSESNLMQDHPGKGTVGPWRRYSIY